MRCLYIIFILVTTMVSQGLHAFGNVYGAFTLGTEKFTQIDRYEAALGFEWEPFSYFTLATEARYSNGEISIAVPSTSKNRPISVGYLKRGMHYVPVQSFELWVRPKLRIPLPYVKPYLVGSVSPLGFNYEKGAGAHYSLGIGALLGVDVDISCIRLFVETGFIARFARTSIISLPLNIGIGYHW